MCVSVCVSVCVCVCVCVYVCVCARARVCFSDLPIMQVTQGSKAAWAMQMEQRV